MSARSHGTDEPVPDDPHEPAPDDPTIPPATPVDPPEPADLLDPDEVDSRFTAIVTQLRGPADPRSWAPDPVVAEAEEHFVPPEPGPVFGGNPLLTMAWCAAIGMPLFFLVAALAWPGVPVWLLQAAGVMFLAGAGVLLWRMPHDRDDDDGPGAVV